MGIKWLNGDFELRISVFRIREIPNPQLKSPIGNFITNWWFTLPVLFCLDLDFCNIFPSTKVESSNTILQLSSQVSTVLHQSTVIQYNTVEHTTVLHHSTVIPYNTGVHTTVLNHSTVVQYYNQSTVVHYNTVVQVLPAVTFPVRSKL